ncbi:sensor histidine kinase [Cellulomonas pakistanensis]|uniref:sensor histidine kinase n=1 Tax=Cellulomonas pakistanensis TaxID=992287 RepID=UPI0019413874|nr:HAMP domain-containing sensor histidine kinase [Cellulomonas pakistanensis]
MASRRPRFRWRRLVPRLRSTRTRILVAYILLLATSLLVAGFAARTVLVEGIREGVETDLTQEVEELQRLVGGNDPSTGLPFAGDLRAIFDTFFERNATAEDEALYAFVAGDPYLTSASPPAQLTADPAFVREVRGLTEPRRGHLESSAGPVEYLAVPVVGTDPATQQPSIQGVFVVAEFTEDRLARVDTTMGRIGLALLALLAVVSVAAYVVAGRLLAPLRRAVETARAIHENDLSARMPVSGSDEIAELGQTFNEMLDRVERALASQRDFVSDAGHELRTPITIVRGHLEVMTDDPADREETVALVLDELDRMARLVHDLLLLSRSERPDFIDHRTVAVQTLLPDVFAKVSALADREWVYDGAVPSDLEADPQRLTQALTQLAQNAVQHTTPGQVIALGASRDGDHVHIWVRDEGEGVAEVDRDRIFERFARATAQPRRSDGHGLGLAIVMAVVEGHGGQVRLDSEVGRGSTFRLVLPAKRSGRARGRAEHDRGDRA